MDFFMESDAYLRYCISARIAALRKEAGATQKQLAYALGVPRSDVASWETGVREPNALQCKLLSKHFGVTVDYLCGFTDGKRDVLPFLDEKKISSPTFEQYDHKVKCFHSVLEQNKAQTTNE